MTENVVDLSCLLERIRRIRNFIRKKKLPDINFLLERNKDINTTIESFSTLITNVADPLLVKHVTSSSKFEKI
jgi:hypothetical protein